MPSQYRRAALERHLAGHGAAAYTDSEFQSREASFFVVQYDSI